MTWGVRDRGRAARRRGSSCTLALIAAATMVASGAPPATAAGEVTANATGRVIAVAPVSGGLSLEVGLGSSIADLKGTTPRAESATLKPGILGLLAGSTVPLPSPAKADLRSQKEVDRGSVAPPLDLGAVRMTASRERASVTSAEDDGGLGAQARTDLSNVEVAGLVEIGGGTSAAAVTTQRAEGSASLAQVKVQLAGVTLLDLQDVEWRVSAELGETPAASFSVGSATIQGDRQAINSPEDLRSALEPLSPLMAPAGLSITVPQSSEVEGGLALSPLVIQSVNASVLRSTVGAAYPQIAPIYNEIATQLQGQVAEAGLALLVANVALSIAAGNGGVRLTLGGASATIAPRPTLSVSPTTSGPSTAASSGSATPASASISTVDQDLGAPTDFFTSPPAERSTTPISAANSVGNALAAPSARSGGALGSPLPELVTQPSATEESSASAAAVLAAILAAALGLATRDQFSVRRREALREARARAGTAI